MIIGQIDYLNLLPFDVFVKSYDSSLYFRMKRHRSYPAKINRLFLTRRVHAGFVSSIITQKQHKHNMGIVAYKKVQSVLIKRQNTHEISADPHSQTSNVLANILSLKGEVIIGDRALRARNQNDYDDMATLWYQRYKLPFVFAVFCSNHYHHLYQKITKLFVKNHPKIPQYILARYANQSQIAPSAIRAYLRNIHYHIGIKERKALYKFFRLAKKNGKP